MNEETILDKKDLIKKLALSHGFLGDFLEKHIESKRTNIDYLILDEGIIVEEFYNHTQLEIVHIPKGVIIDDFEYPEEAIILNEILKPLIGTNYVPEYITSILNKPYVIRVVVDTHGSIVSIRVYNEIRPPEVLNLWFEKKVAYVSIHDKKLMVKGIVIGNRKDDTIALGKVLSTYKKIINSQLKLMKRYKTHGSSITLNGWESYNE